MIPSFSHKSSFALLVALACCAIAGCAQRQAAHVLSFAPDRQKMTPGAAADHTSQLAVINNRLGRLGRARLAGVDNLIVEIYRQLNDEELASLKRRISAMGQLEFCVLAVSPLGPFDQGPINEKARSLPPSEKDVIIDGEKVAEWIADVADVSGVFTALHSPFVGRRVGSDTEVLVLIDSWDGSGDYVQAANLHRGQRGQSVVKFTLNSTGTGRMAQLTAGAENHTLGIILDKRLISAPKIIPTISDRAQISGGSFNQHELESILAILKAGALPYPLKLVHEQANVAPAATGLPLLTPMVIVLATGLGVLTAVGIVILAMKARPR